MSALLLAMVLSAGPNDLADSRSNSGTAQSDARPYHEISADVRDAMKREALAENEAEQFTAIRDMAALYLELKHDPRLNEAPTLQQYKAKLWSRLTRVKKQLQRDIDRQNRELGRTAEEIDAELLARQQADETAASLAQQLSLVSYSMGGPGKLFAETGGGFGGAPVPDNGQALVELIQTIIQPDFWDVNGGPGSIVYYAPLKVLVVRATHEIHRQLGGGIGKIRAAGP